MKRKVFFLSLFAATMHVPSAHAQEGILPIPNYRGELAEREYLTGDWGGTRPELANKGVQFRVDYTQSLQNIAEGGRSESTSYGGSLDYTLDLDLMRMGILPGALIKVRGETRYGTSANGDSGTILPVNTDSFFPLTRSLDDTIGFTLTTVSYTQFLSESFALTAGKFDTLDGDPNEFASGRGVSQFMNANFIFNSATALRFPYSTTGGGIIWNPVPVSADSGITYKSLVVTTTDSSETSGLEYFDDGLSWINEVNLAYALGTQKLPGGMNVGVLYSFDQDFSKFGNRFTFQPGQGLSQNNEDDTWAGYWSGWQYLVVDDPSGKAINLLDGIPDRQGFGVFSRAGLADEDTNPVQWALSGGVAGRGVFGRSLDSYGVGYYYTDLQTSRLSSAVSIEDHAQGVELFYNIGITPAAFLTLDVQSVESTLPSVDTAYIFGARLRLTL